MQITYGSGTYISGHGVCQWGKCMEVGARCSPEGFCPEHCKEYHKEAEHYKAGEFRLVPATLEVEEKLN